METYAEAHRDAIEALWNATWDDTIRKQLKEPLFSPSSGHALVVEPTFDLLSGELLGFKETCRSERITQYVIETGGEVAHLGLINKSEASSAAIGVRSRRDGFHCIPPGFEKGIDFATPSDFVVKIQNAALEEKQASVMSTLAKLEITEPKMNSIAPANPSTSDTVDESEELKQSVLTSIATATRKSAAAKTGIQQSGWAKALDANHVPPDYESVVSEPAFTYPFELDPFQKQAIYHLERGENVFVAAHTSAGKTAVAEYAIGLARKHLTKAIYTSPIKALSNQKCRDLHRTFDDVGLLTGDVQVRPDASCLIMTTEILRSMLYRGADLISDVEFVIFDEVHYVNDQERGVVWEEVLIMLPPHVVLVLLSATIPNTLEFADWIGRTRQRPVNVISTLKRPVPLEHHLYVDKEMIPLVTADRRFLTEDGYKRALTLTLQKGSSGKASLGAVAPKNTQGGLYRGIKQERNLWTDILYLLRKKTLLPAVVFVFSKRKCEENVDALANVDLTTASEKSAIHLFLQSSIIRLRPEDRLLPQIQRMSELLSRGLAVHHSGLLPILKEAVEILFSRGLVKVLFATETFAMGVNMPARTVVFSSIRKHDGTSLRVLLPGEYTQMAGRAGRRGLDATGTVIIVCPEEVPAEATLRSVILGLPTKLTSQFRLTYGMILNLLRVEALRIEEIIKKSFGENASQKQLPQEQQRLHESEAKLAAATVLECSRYLPDIGEYYGTCENVTRNGQRIHSFILSDHKLTHRLLEPGRIILVKVPGKGHLPAVYLKSLDSEMLSFFLLTNPISNNNESNNNNKNTDAERGDEGERELPFDHFTRIDVERPLERETISLPIGNVLMITEDRISIPQNLSQTTFYHSRDLDAIQDAFLTHIRSTISHQQEQDQEQEQQPHQYAEIEMPLFKKVDIDEARINRTLGIRQLSHFGCRTCPDLLDHYAIYHARRMLTEQLAELQFRLSDNSLALLPEYHARIALLKHLNYVDAGGNVQLKGRVACDLNTVSELITTELLFENAFQEMNPAEIIALLSAMVFQERHHREAPDLAHLPSLALGVEKFKQIALHLDDIHRQHGLDATLADSLRFGLVEVVYEWARGTPFTTLTTLTDVLEGSIVRCIVRLDETCREVCGAARIMGDPILFKKMEEASRAIKRDICFASSLYL